MRGADPGTARGRRMGGGSPYDVIRRAAALLGLAATCALFAALSAVPLPSAAQSPDAGLPDGTVPVVPRPRPLTAEASTGETTAAGNSGTAVGTNGDDIGVAISVGPDAVDPGPPLAAPGIDVAPTGASGPFHPGAEAETAGAAPVSTDAPDAPPGQSAATAGAIVETSIPLNPASSDRVPSSETAANAPLGAGGAANVGIATPPAPEPQLSIQEFATQRWREAVMAGETDLGREDWFAMQLSGPATGDPAIDGATATGTDGSASADGTGSDSEDDTVQARRVHAASERWQDRTSPVTLGTAGRVVTVFGESIPVAYCSPLKVCLIELEAGENLTDTPSWGDSARWQVQPKLQGRDPERVIIEVKPLEDAETTNLAIPTDRRLYVVTLHPSTETHTPILSFRWPDSEAAAVQAFIDRAREEERAEATRREAAEAEAAALIAEEHAHGGLDTETGTFVAEDLDFAFDVSGRADFRPVRVFADGERTYVDLDPGYEGPLPALVAGDKEPGGALNTRVAENGTRIVADRVVTDVWLQSDSTRVRIRRTRQ